MSSEINKKYFLGLDIGTNSVGWAVTDTDYNVLRAKGKKLWGVRLFDEAETAKGRRTKRTARRRRDRQKLRLMWLDEIFRDEINKLDPNMLDRMKYSSLWEEDKATMNDALKSKDSLFHGEIDGKEYSDREFHDEYPTIYHLRHELTQSPARDVRFLYLAIHNIMKARGHFLFEGDFGDNANIVGQFKDMIDDLLNLSDQEIYPIVFENIDENEIRKFESTLLDKTKGIRDKKQSLYDIFNTKEKYSKNLLDLIVTGSSDLKKIFVVDEECKCKIEFASEKYDEELGEAEKYLNENQLILLDKIKAIYDSIQLKKILGDSDYICDAMVESYNIHKTQLKDFKSFIHTYYKSYYSKMFRYYDKIDPAAKDTEKPKKNLSTNYSLYVNRDILSDKKQVLGINLSDRTVDSFYKYIRSILSLSPECENYNVDEFESKKNEILKQMELGQFLKKQRTKDNSVFPNKLLLKELKKILSVNETKFDFLKKVDSTGISNSEKILQIMTFRVPYFVGPIGNNPNGENNFTWSRKKKDISLYPWTLKDIIDYNEAEDAFILRMTNKCSYLHDQDVLPKHSMIYEKYMVLNELNKLTLNGNPISVELKQNIFNLLFKKYENVTIKRLKEYLKCANVYSEEELEDLVIGGIDKGFNTSYLTYVKLSNNFGEEYVNRYFDIFEKIIKYATIISDKNRLHSRIVREFGDVLDNIVIEKLKGYTYSGWGALSFKFLEQLNFINQDTSEVTNIMSELWNTNQNLQQILNNKVYTIEKELSEYENKANRDVTYSDVESLYCSPAVKRAVWQTILIIQELEKVLGGKPEKIFVEVTRGDGIKGDKGRKSSRLDSLKKLYSEIDESMYVTKTQLDELNAELNRDENTRLRSEKVYLYYLQNGKCAYSGEKINIAELYNDNLYDIDHIIPQSKLKDDSLDNKVLVKKELNLRKTDEYPLPSNIISKMKPFWEYLKSVHLLSSKKYENLIRTNKLSEDELGGFISRQLVETNQSAKAVIDFLKTMVDNPRNVVYSKARFVSEFRNMFKIWKSRSVNDYHHAVDAYLNIVVGNTYNARYTDDPRHFYRKNKNSNHNVTVNPIKLFEGRVYSWQTDEVVWDKERDAKRITDICLRNDVITTRMSFSLENQAFYNETVYKSRHNDPKSSAVMGLKGNENDPLKNMEKYGGYGNLNNAYFVLVEDEGKKGVKEKYLLAVPTIIVYKYRNDKDKDSKILEYLENANGLNNPKILMKKINYQSTLLVDKGRYVLGGKTSNQLVLHNFNEWKVDNNITRYVKNLEKYNEMIDSKKYKLEEKNDEIVLSEASKDGNIERKITRQENIALYDTIIDQLSKDMYKGLALDTALRVKLEKERDNFVNKTVGEQAKELIDYLKGLSTGAQTPSIMSFITLNSKITKKNIKLLIQSPAGLFERSVKL